VDIDLLAADPTPRAAWQVIDAARQQAITGELVLGTAPPTRVYLLDGEVYFAERSTDGTLPVRLLAEAVLTHEQLRDGVVMVDGVDHLGRLFERQPLIERDAVETCVELMTEQVLTEIAEQGVSSARLTLYRRHRNGIDRWQVGRSRARLAAAPLAPTVVAEPAALPQRRPTEPASNPQQVVVGPEALSQVVAEAVQRAMLAVTEAQAPSRLRRASDAS
jgi:hypothetical protein